MANKPPRLREMKSRLASAPAREMGSINVSERRITGRPLQRRRFELWKQNPRCAICGILVDYPYGFELDHIVPLFQGGEDVPENCQLLCVYTDPLKGKSGCHIDKTKEDLRG